MNDWPELDPDRDGETFAVLHLASQMLGKIRVAHATWQNHGWHLTLRPAANGLTILPTPSSPGRSFTLTLDLCAHGISLAVSDGERDMVPFAGQTVADIHAGLIAMLDKHGLPSRFNGRPNEVPDAVRFEDDRAERRYDADSARRLLTALQLVVPIFDRFRAGFLGKASPVHFFWGSFDLAVTRFSGRPAPPRADADPITREAYSHEVISHGWWPGQGPLGKPAFYSYTAPAPDGLSGAPLRPSKAFWSNDLSEFLMYYDDVRTAANPDEALMEFLQSTYEAGANLAKWDRASLER